MTRFFAIIVCAALFGCADSAVDRTPVAVVSTRVVGAPNVAIPIDGSRSYAIGTNGEANPDIAIESYDWIVLKSPPGATATIDGSGANVTVTGNVLGTYRVLLRVTDAKGRESLNYAVTSVYIEPWANLEVELTWGTEGVDVDLHLVPEGELYTWANDCSYVNTNPDWGSQGVAADNPIHLGEIDDGTAAEMIFASNPPPGLYHVYAHFFHDHLSGRAAGEVRVNVRASGVAIGSFGPRTIGDPRLVWYAGTISWPNPTLLEVDVLLDHDDDLFGINYTD